MQSHPLSENASSSSVRKHSVSRGAGAKAAPDKRAGLLNTLTIITHDLRSPLANLAVLVDLIETYAHMQSLDRVKASTRKAQEMIQALDHLLNGFLGRVRESGDPLAFKPALLDVSEVVTAAVALNEPIAQSRGIRIDRRAVRPVTMSGDRALLIQAVDNLISNAVKHAPKGSVVVCTLAEVGRDALVSISDEGSGLSELQLKRAFTPFATLSSSYRERTASWGLGLWIVRLIAERHGGHVEVTSSGRGRGARFDLSLPILPF
jgi:signal transduction histidine kinase